MAIVAIDHPPVNALSDVVRAALCDALAALAADPTLRAIVISGAAGRFIAGADIREMDLPLQKPFLPELIGAIEAFPVPVIAAIDGPALGGGAEVALSCDYRIGTELASLGLPETRLGLVPGAGGTQRLPRLVGVTAAIEIIAGAKIVRAKSAAEFGLLDELVDGDSLIDACIAAAATVGKRPVSLRSVEPPDNRAVGRAVAAAKRRPLSAAAVDEAIRLVELSAVTDFHTGISEERRVFLQLRAGDDAAALRYLFRAERAARKIPELENVSSRTVKAVAVVGGGTMGAGIAAALSDAGFPVTVVERDESALAAQERIRQIYEKQVVDGRLSEQLAKVHLARIRVTPDWSAIANVDFAIEAAFEDMDVKREVFARLDAMLRPDAVLATNTSYLSVEAIARATRRPQDVVGLHFFAPADVMKLLEVVRTPLSAPDTIATATWLAQSLRKTWVLAADAQGFIGNRVYTAYRRHAEYLLEDGSTVEQIDLAMCSYGFPMGPFAVADLSGLDIAYAMRRRNDAARPSGQRYVAIPDRLVERHRLGRKTGGGYYDYRSGKQAVSLETSEIIEAARREKAIRPKEIPERAIRDRLLAVMANEGAKLLSEGVALRASDIDIAFVNGFGFPARKGGPMFAAERWGIHNVLAEMERAYAAGGEGAEPSPLLQKLARSGGTFADCTVAGKSKERVE